jgi:hypothetical protein
VQRKPYSGTNFDSKIVIKDGFFFFVGSMRGFGKKLKLLKLLLLLLLLCLREVISVENLLLRGLAGKLGAAGW